MKALILSDLHLDHWSKTRNRILFDFISNTQVDCIFCAGDACQVNSPQNWELFLESLRVPCFYVMGNHDAYGTSILQAKEFLHDKALHSRYFNFLDNNYTIFNGYVIVGSPLYTDFNLFGNGIVEATHPRYKMINDFGYIHNDQEGGCITPHDYISLHNQAREYLTRTITEHKDGKVILLTHWIPSRYCITPEYANDAFNPYFAVECSHLLNINTSVKYWVYGHTHSSYRTNIGNTAFICNPRGYPDERKKWRDNNFIVEL